MAMKKISNQLALYLLISFTSFANAENLEQWALEQQKNIQRLSVSYKGDVEKIKAHIKERQQSGDINEFTTWLKNESAKQVPSSSEKRYPNVLVFVSFSMPKASITEWLAQAKQVGGNLVIRGLINNSFKDTATVLIPLFKKQAGGLLLDPNLFKHFGITKVPAVVVQENKVACPVNQSCQEHFAIVYGNTNLQYALTKVANSRTQAAPTAQQAIQKLKETH